WPAGRPSRVSARQPTYFSCFAKRSRQEKATPMMAPRCAGCTRRQHRNREASETRFAQTADASLSDFGTGDVSPSTGIHGNGSDNFISNGSDNGDGHGNDMRRVCVRETLRYTLCASSQEERGAWDGGIKATATVAARNINGNGNNNCRCAERQLLRQLSLRGQLHRCTQTCSIQKGLPVTVGPLCFYI
ncbi:hypothetical protein SAMN06295970_106226, partial [Noviherbaspirillum suwonense]